MKCKLTYWLAGCGLVAAVACSRPVTTGRYQHAEGPDCRLLFDPAGARLYVVDSAVRGGWYRRTSSGTYVLAGPAYANDSTAVDTLAAVPADGLFAQHFTVSVYTDRVVRHPLRGLYIRVLAQGNDPYAGGLTDSTGVVTLAAQLTADYSGSRVVDSLRFVRHLPPDVAAGMSTDSVVFTVPQYDRPPVYRGVPHVVQVTGAADTSFVPIPDTTQRNYGVRVYRDATLPLPALNAFRIRRARDGSLWLQAPGLRNGAALRLQALPLQGKPQP